MPPQHKSQELLIFEEKLHTERHKRDLRLGELHDQARMLHEANQALVKSQYPSHQQQGPVGNDMNEPGTHDDSMGSTVAVRSLCRIAGCSTTGALIAALLPQQVGSTTTYPHIRLRCPHHRLSHDIPITSL